jgi:hypothetical protein
MSAITGVPATGLPGATISVDTDTCHQATNVPTQLGAIPQHVLQALENAGQSFCAQQPGLGAISPGFVPRDSQTDRKGLEEAESLAEQAFARASSPGATLQDKFMAQQEMQQANDLRNTIAARLSPELQQQISQIGDQEQQAVNRVSNPNASMADKLGAQFQMQHAEQQWQSVDNTMRNNPVPEPPCNNLKTTQQKLDQAENLAQDAFARVSKPHVSKQDRLIAQQEMQEADQLRQSAASGLPSQLRDQINQVSDAEHDAFARVSGRHASRADKLTGQLEMNVADQKSKVIDQELHIPSYLRNPIR